MCVTSSRYTQKLLSEHADTVHSSHSSHSSRLIRSRPARRRRLESCAPSTSQILGNPCGYCLQLCHTVAALHSRCTLAARSLSGNPLTLTAASYLTAPRTSYSPHKPNPTPNALRKSQQSILPRPPPISSLQHISWRSKPRRIPLHSPHTTSNLSITTPETAS